MWRCLHGLTRWLRKYRTYIFCIIGFSTVMLFSYSPHSRADAILRQISLRIATDFSADQHNSTDFDIQMRRSLLIQKMAVSQDDHTKLKILSPETTHSIIDPTTATTTTTAATTTTTTTSKPKPVPSARISTIKRLLVKTTPVAVKPKKRWVYVEQQNPEDLMSMARNESCLNASISGLRESVAATKAAVEQTVLAARHPEMKDGHYTPASCQPTEKLAIIVPFRDRQKHLFTLLPNLIPMLKKQGIDFTIFVVEQDLPTSFNKGVVYNAGFLEALKFDNYDCFIFHDVDMLPLSEQNLYRCDARGPVHYMAGVNKFNYGLYYSWLIGGVLGFSTDQYRKVNGFSNLYFGWGAEDDDMSHRIASTEMKIYRRPKKIGLYDMIKHNRDKRWSPNKGRHAIVSSAQTRRPLDGLNTVKYTLTKVEKTPLFIHIHIFVNMTEVYKTAPASMKRVIEIARESDRRNRIKEGTGV